MVSIKAVNSLGKTDCKSEGTICKPVMQEIGTVGTKIEGAEVVFSQLPNLTVRTNPETIDYALALTCCKISWVKSMLVMCSMLCSSCCLSFSFLTFRRRLLRVVSGMIPPAFF
jgi:hypothetical protein